MPLTETVVKAQMRKTLKTDLDTLIVSGSVAHYLLSEFAALDLDAGFNDVSSWTEWARWAQEVAAEEKP